MFTKHLTLTLALALGLPLFSACAPTEAQPVAVSQTRQKSGNMYVPRNSAQAYGLKINGETLRGIFYSTTPPRGIAASPTGWWLRSSSTDYYAPITSITYGGESVADLSTVQGWLQVTTPSSESVTTLDTGTALYLTIGAPMNKLLRITHDSSEGTYGKYTAEWSESTGGGWNPACPHPYLNGDGVTTNLTEHMIPVGNALWHLNGSKTTPSQTIQLSCTHDSIGGCVTWGYHPWDGSLASAHQACTRMKRGDFCGTGDPATTINASEFEHTLIQIWDGLGIHDSMGQTPSTMEAYWDERGATCFNRSEYRSDNGIAQQRMLTTIQNNCPMIQSCDKGSSGILASSRPCTSYNDEGTECLDN